MSKLRLGEGEGLVQRCTVVSVAVGSYSLAESLGPRPLRLPAFPFFPLRRFLVLDQGWLCSPGGLWQHLETLLMVTAWRG